MQPRGYFKQLKEKGKRAKKALYMKTGWKAYNRLYLICDGGSGGTPCSHVHGGFEVEVPGPMMKRLAPVLLVSAKILSVAKIAGSLVAGVAVPVLPTSFDSNVTDFMSQVQYFT